MSIQSETSNGQVVSEDFTIEPEGEPIGVEDFEIADVVYQPLTIDTLEDLGRIISKGKRDAKLVIRLAEEYDLGSRFMKSHEKVVADTMNRVDHAIGPRPSSAR